MSPLQGIPLLDAPYACVHRGIIELSINHDAFKPPPSLAPARGKTKLVPGYPHLQKGDYSLDGIIPLGVYSRMANWDIEYTDEFQEWWNLLTEEEQISVAASVGLLEARGPNLGFPHCSGIESSKHDHMRELRTQHAGCPYRTLYAFDPRRTAILLIGGNKTGNDRWYEEFVPIADHLYDEHINELRKEGLIDG